MHIVAIKNTLVDLKVDAAFSQVIRIQDSDIDTERHLVSRGSIDCHNVVLDLLEPIAVSTMLTSVVAVGIE